MAELWTLVLAAGASRRLGLAKQLVRIDGEPLVHRTACLALEVSDGCLAVLGANADDVSAALNHLPVTRVLHQKWADGMGGSIAAGVHQLPDSADGVMILPCDLPTLEEQELAALVNRWREDPSSTVAARYDEVVGAPAIFPRKRFGKLAGLSGDRGASRWLKKKSVVTVELPSARNDLDRPEDLDRITRS